MFWDKWFKKETVGEPVLTLVEQIKQNPKKHDLKIIARNHIVFYYNGDVNWQFSVAVSKNHVYASDKAEWMNNAEKVYVYNELIGYALGDQYSRQGWMKKVMGDDNAAS